MKPSIATIAALRCGIEPAHSRKPGHALHAAFRLLLACLMFFAPPLASAAGFTVNTSGSALSGLWWNQSESGWGMSLTQQGPIVFVAWYAYDASGAPVWYVMSNCAVFADSCSGELYKVSGGTPPTIPWNGAAKLVTRVGTGTLAFADVNSATFSYVLNGVAGSRNIVRQVFASGASAPAVDYTALWWNADESGWGVALTQQYGTIFATWYTYDASGNPVWYVASNCVVIGSGCSGDLFQVTGGTPPTAIWNGAGKQTAKVGSISFAFSGSAAGTMSYTVNGASGSRSISRQVFYTAPAPVTLGSFHGNIVLGSPTETSVRANVFSPDQGGTVSLSFGTTPGIYDKQSAAMALTAAKPLELTLDGLSANTRYFYRLQYQSATGTSSGPTEEYTFHTARPAGSTFSFTIQADSHLDENSDLAQYRKTLGNALADAPDFHLDLGDTFMCEKHAEPFSAIVRMSPDRATVDARYQYERSNFGILAHSAPIFLVNGNHEGEAGWLNDGSAQNIAVWTTLARQQNYPNPVPDNFYSGEAAEEAFVGKRASWYAWQWGDAQFVVLDPFWYSKAQASKDAWNLTLGERQYQWLLSTLSTSRAKFKFIFIHNLVGGLDGQMRGGVEAAPYFEWGGRNLDGSSVFSQKRPGWSLPIHQMLVRYGVTAVFHGHDHLYAKQDLDGVVYLEVPQPSAKNFLSEASLAAEYHYAAGTILGSSGHIRVTVSPEGVTAQYVRSWLPANETSQRKNAQIDDIWNIAAPK
jgi:hypothetical protein